VLKGFSTIFEKQIQAKSQVVKKSGKLDKPYDILREIGRVQQEKEKAEYEKLLKNGNGNGA
jgi:hypothetical protein